MFIKLLSYLYPITVKTYQSDYSGKLEITYQNGKKVIDTKNANYSYGTLQKILDFGLQKINITTVNSILVLGLGGGSVIDTLYNKYQYSNKITAVELDKVMIDVAAKEFGITATDKLTIVNGDALKFIAESNKKFDLIIIDLFIDVEVPESVYSTNFFNHIYNRLTSKGQFIFNASLTHSAIPKSLTDNLKRFEIQTFTKVLSTNTIITGCKIL